MTFDSSTDRRIQRTKKSVIDAFVHLVRERSYGEIRVGDVLEDAAVGRSTFYEHYRGKDDVLTQAFSILYDSLAGCVDLTLRGQDDHGHFTMLLEHFWENRDLFRRLTTGDAAGAYARSTKVFARRLAERLDAFCRERGVTPRVPLSHTGASLAQAQLALLDEWLVGRDAGQVPAAELAETLRGLIRGHVRALIDLH